MALSQLSTPRLQYNSWSHTLPLPNWSHAVVQRARVRVNAAPAKLPPREVLREVCSIGDDTMHRVNRVHLGLLDALEAKRILPVLLALTQRCQLSSQEWQKVLIRHPAIFNYYVEDVEDVIDFLVKDVGLSSEQLRSVVARFPQVFSYSVKAHLRPQLSYLESLGVAHEQLADYITARPLLLGEGIETVIKFLRLCGVPRKQLASLLRTYPIDYCCRFIYNPPVTTSHSMEEEEE